MVVRPAAEARRRLEKEDSPCSAGWSWSSVREKHCYLAGGWRLELELE